MLKDFFRYDSEATEATWVAKDSMCDSAVGEVLYFTKGNECGCETPEVGFFSFRILLMWTM